jgi:CP family cyanate transporter-like MFS transporter
VSQNRLRDPRVLLAALFIASFGLRPQLSGVGPLLPEIQRDLGVSHATAGLLGAIPVLCMGLFAFPVTRLLSLASPRAIITACLIAIAGSSLIRAAAPSIIGVLLFTLPFGIATGVLGSTLPVVVKVQFPRKAALATGTYAVGINLGAAGAAALAVPLAYVVGGWRGSLAILALVCSAAIPAWIALTDRTQLSTRVPIMAPRIPWTSTVAWALALVFGLQAVCFYGLNAWLASAYGERGWGTASTGALVATLNVVAVAGVVLVPLLVGRSVARLSLLLLGAAVLLIATLGLVLVPERAWPWVVLASLSLGVLFSLSLTLAVDMANTSQEASSIAAMQLGIGYTLAGLAPFVMGVFRDSTGTFATSLWTLVAVSGCLVGVVLAICARAGNTITMA